MWQPPFQVPLLAPGFCSDPGQPPARPKFKSISKCFHLTSYCEGGQGQEGVVTAVGKADVCQEGSRWMSSVPS